MAMVGAADMSPRHAGPDRDYLVLVASEATDQITLVRFGPAGARIERVMTVGANPVEPDGPHGLAALIAAARWPRSRAAGWNAPLVKACKQ